MPSTYILIAVIIGILLLVIIHFYYVSIENFTSSPDTNDKTSPAPAPTDPKIQDTIDQLTSLISSVGDENATPVPYIEKLNDIPEKKSLVLYATTFSDKTNYNNNMDVYSPSSQKWNNFINDKQSFFIVTSKSLPASIKTPYGLPIKDIRLEGIQSDEINKSDFMLKSFSISLFIQFNNLNFDNIIELFNISLETPNYVRLTLEKNPANPMEIFLYSQVGDSDPNCKSGCVINVATLTSSSSPIAISMVYTKVGDTTGMRQLYINNVESHKSNEYTISSPLVLGNSRITINKTANLDATLFAFMYYTSALTLSQHNDIVAYLNHQRSTVPHIISQIKDMTNDKLDIIRKLLADQSLSTENLKEKLNKCIAQSTPLTPPEFKYKVFTVGNQPTEGVTSFNIRNRLQPPAQSQTSTQSTSPDFKYKVFTIGNQSMEGVSSFNIRNRLQSAQSPAPAQAITVKP